jgi:CYTH domain-containing protein/predicted ATPase
MKNLSLQETLGLFFRSKNTEFVVITGGPGAGKTTLMEMAVRLLQKNGIYTVVVPEVAREFIGAGFMPNDDRWKTDLAFQKNLFLAMVEKEARFLRTVQDMNLGDQKVVFLHDRGLMDSQAYVGEKLFQNLLESFELTASQCTDRYSGVIHLVTAADGAVEFYCNDDQRFESPELARELCQKTYNAWQSHQHVSIVDNSTDFPEKMNRALLALNRIVSMPIPTEIEKKWLLTEFILDSLPPDHDVLEIKQTYLDLPDRPGIECRVREVCRNVSSKKEFSYFYTEKTDTETEGMRGESERQISRSEYNQKIKVCFDKSRRPVEKTRYKFRYGSHVCEVDIFHGRLEGLVTMEVEFKDLSEMEEFVLPSFLHLTDVTDDVRYSNYNLSKLGIPV